MRSLRHVAPGDEGAIIDKRVRERDGSDDDERELVVKRQRQRSNTISLVDENGPGVDTVPRPEQDLSRYNKDRLEQGLRYLHKESKRKITPRTAEFLVQYKDAYKVALEDKDPAAARVVQAMDKLYYSSAYYFKARTAEEDKKLNCYLTLRRLELLANYGDYLGQEPQEIRFKLKRAAVGSSTEVRDAASALGSKSTWLEIANRLEGVELPVLRTHIDIACEVLGLEAGHLEWLIKEWGSPNRTFHNQIREHIQNCLWGSVAEQLCRDLKELRHVEADPETISHYEHVLLALREEYFIVKDEDQPQYWKPNEKADRLQDEKLERDRKKSGKHF